MRESIEVYKTYNPELYTILKQSRIYQDKTMCSYLKLTLGKISLELPEIIKNSHRQQNEILRSFRELVARIWQNNQIIEGYEYYVIFRELYEEIDINLLYLHGLKSHIQQNLQKGKKQQSYQEALQIVEDYQEELKADKKKMQKLKNAWKTILAEDADEGHKE